MLSSDMVHSVIYRSIRAERRVCDAGVCKKGSI